jgi:hypothetical protein
VDSVVGGFPNAHVTFHLHMVNRERRGRQIGTTGASGDVSHGEMSSRQDSFLALLLLLAAARGCRRRLGFLWCLILCLRAVCSGSVLHSSIFGGYSRVSLEHSMSLGNMPIPSAFSGSAAICLPIRPTPAISLPTSALFSVLNFSVVPDTGSYAFTSSVALGTLGASASVFSFSSADARFLFLFAYFSVSRFGMWYLVVMRAYVAKSIHQHLVQKASDESRTYAPWPGVHRTAAWLVAAIPPWCRDTPSLLIRTCGAVVRGIRSGIRNLLVFNNPPRMKSSTGTWRLGKSTIMLSFSLIREVSSGDDSHAYTSVSRDSLSRLTGYSSPALKKRPDSASPKALVGGRHSQNYIA